MGVYSNHSDIWSVGTGIQLTHELEYCQLLKVDTSGTYIGFTNRFPLKNMAIEFDIYVDGENGAENSRFCASIQDQFNPFLLSLDNIKGSFRTWYHIKMVIDENLSKMPVYKDYSTTPTTEKSYNNSYVMENNVDFRFWCFANLNEIRYKNFIVYRIQ